MLQEKNTTVGKCNQTALSESHCIHVVEFATGASTLWSANHNEDSTLHLCYASTGQVPFLSYFEITGEDVPHVFLITSSVTKLVEDGWLVRLPARSLSLEVSIV